MKKDLDEKLYDDYLNGDKEAFEVLYNKYKSKIEYFIYNIVKDYQRAEDLTQETFIYAMQNGEKRRSSFKYYIYLVARSKAFNYKKVEDRRNEITELYLLKKDEETEKDILDIITKDETNKEILEEIELLDEKYKNAIYLVNIEGLSYAETSRILGETLQNTKSLIHRGKRQLRIRLLKKGFNEMNKVAKILLIIITTTVLVGGIAYAVTGGKIIGRPIIEWFKVNFSDEYENYRVEVEGKEIKHNKTKINLVSTVCDEGFTILEFDVKLSDKDKKYLKIGEPVLTDEYLNSISEEKGNRIIKAYNKKTGSEEECTEKEYLIRRYGGEIIEDSLLINFNKKFKEDALQPKRAQLANRNIIIDGEKHWVRFAMQSLTNISDNEYKLYQMYFLTDKELGDKKEFTITLKDVIITTKDWQLGDEDKFIEIDGQFDVKVSKEKALENVQRIKVNCEDIKYKNLKQKVESVKITPLQTIVKMHTVYNNVSYDSLSNSSNKNYVALGNFKVLDENGEEINSEWTETKRIVTYSNGKVEEWNAGQIEPSNFSFRNAKMETTEYILIETNPENHKIKIIPQDMLEQISYSERVFKDMGSFEINLDDKEENIQE